MSIFNNKYNFSNIKFISDIKKLKLLIFLIFLTITIWYLLIYSKVNKQIIYNKSLLNQIEAKNAIIEQSTNKCIKLEKKINIIKSDINCSRSKNSKKDIINYAKESGLALKAYMLLGTDSKLKQIKSELELEQQTQKDIASYEFTGKINQIITFCQKLCLCKSCLEFEEINITKKTDQECNIKCTIKLLKQQNSVAKQTI
ncbi:MAG: hypothetical protein UR12_C0024G0002 [candidate division TM6 bacterium GW2011_GWF2_30_66]|nr:MAG: hypothetical protein UR12_C0024G0002 [candidate division TM6 bacterium GW2011_GWF2_30_66]